MLVDELSAFQEVGDELFVFFVLLWVPFLIAIGSPIKLYNFFSVNQNLLGAFRFCPRAGNGLIAMYDKLKFPPIGDVIHYWAIGAQVA